MARNPIISQFVTMKSRAALAAARAPMSGSSTDIGTDACLGAAGGESLAGRCNRRRSQANRLALRALGYMVK